MSGAPDPTQGLGALSSAAQADVTSPPPSTSGPSSAAAIAAAAVLLQQQQQQQQSSYAQGGLTSSPGGSGKNGSEEDARAMDEAFMRCKGLGLFYCELEETVGLLYMWICYRSMNEPCAIKYKHALICRVCGTYYWVMPSIKSSIVYI